MWVGTGIGRGRREEGRIGGRWARTEEGNKFFRAQQRFDAEGRRVKRSTIVRNKRLGMFEKQEIYG